MILCLSLALAAELATVLIEIIKKHLTTIPFPYTLVQGSLIIAEEHSVVNWHSMAESANLQNIYIIQIIR